MKFIVHTIFFSLGLGIFGMVANAGIPEERNAHFLTIGGGYSASGNQVSLEKNIQYLQRVLDGLGRKEDPHTIYFADGSHQGRDLQFYDKDFDIPKINLYLAEFVGSTRGLWNQYRNHEIKVNGPSKSAEISKWFDAKGKKLSGKNDRLLIYFTGHGGRGEKKTPHNTIMYLWQDTNLRVNQFVTELDKLPKELPVTMVMVQCYSGGFSNIIFKEGDPKKGLSDHTRAGFYATVQTRVAAGCTPDINEANYREYSTYFWEALYGETRMGKKVEKPDYNEDGVTSYSEAHAYTILNSRTIDIPVKTSDAFLRHFSKTKNDKKDKKQVEGLLTADSHYQELLELAGPNEKAVLEGLSQQLKLKCDNRGKATRDLAKKLDDSKKNIKKEEDKLKGEQRKLKTNLANLIKADFPEATNAFHPTTQNVLNCKPGEDLVSKIENHKDFKRYEELDEKIDALSQKRNNEDRRWVKTQRLLRALENVALEANLPKIVDCKVLERYNQLVAAENKTF